MSERFPKLIRAMRIVDGVGVWVVRERPTISKEERAKRAPRPPAERVDALHDQVAPTSGRLLWSTPIDTRSSAEVVPDAGYWERLGRAFDGLPTLEGDDDGDAEPFL